jgi:hypothetical protein
LAGIRVLFVRHFTRLFGGHVRHWHYYQHVKKAKGYEPLLLFKGKWDRADNPWRGEPRMGKLNWDNVDVLVLGGVNWNMVGKPPCRVRIINLIQGVQHGDPPRSKYLSRKAIRICMSEEIARIVRSRANGPVFVVNPCVDVPIVQGGKRDIEVLVIGHKMKHIARKIGKAIPSAMILTEFVSRKRFVGLMRRARVVVGLPKRKEGFYLPALEAMCSGALVVCPDCVGNRALVTDGYNCIQPIYTSGHIIDAVKRARALPGPVRRRLLAGGLETAKRNRPVREYRQFMAILRKVDGLWQTA